MASVQKRPVLAQYDTLVMICRGTIEINRIDYAVTFSSEGGFSQIEFSRDGEPIASAQLSFDGRNDQNQTLWRGNVNSGASILIHLSTQTVQPGDEISVGYDGQWGRDQCLEQ